MENFIRIIPKKGFEEWPQKLGQLGRVYHEAEYDTVKKGVRDASTVHMDQHNIKKLLERFNKDGFQFTPLRISGYYQGFSHFHPTVKEGEPFYWYGCLTRTYKDGQKFKEADLKGDHRVIGQMLGYPDCCVKYFEKTFPKVNYDPIWINLQGEVQGWPECNQMLRDFGARITGHLSCSPICKATKVIGERWLDVMKKTDKESAGMLYSLLSQKIIWNSYHGVIQVDTPYFLGLTSSFPYLEKPRIISWSSLPPKISKGRKIKTKK